MVTFILGLTIKMLKLPRNKKLYSGILLISSFMFVNGAANAGYSAVRVKCDDNDTETKIYINNKYKGKCPQVDSIVPAGKITVRAQKQVDDEHEQVFVEQLDIVEGQPQRINVELGSTQLTASAKKARQQAAEKRERSAALADLKAARAGDAAAMAKMTERYTTGSGIAKSTSKANYWKQKRESVLAQTDLAAAKAGDIKAMRTMVQRYREGKGVEKSTKQVELWSANIEAAEAQADLASAKAGDIKAMKTVSERYQTGKGLEQSTDQARYWLQKIDEAEQQKVAEAKRREIQKELDEVSYMNCLKAGMEMIEEEENPFAITLGGPLVSAVSTVMDVVSTPISLSRQAYLSQQLAARPSAWAKPDSMMAKAFQQQVLRTEESKDPLLAAR